MYAQIACRITRHWSAGMRLRGAIGSWKRLISRVHKIGGRRRRRSLSGACRRLGGRAAQRRDSTRRAFFLFGELIALSVFASGELVVLSETQYQHYCRARSIREGCTYHPLTEAFHYVCRFHANYVDWHSRNCCYTSSNDRQTLAYAPMPEPAHVMSPGGRE